MKRSILMGALMCLVVSVSGKTIELPKQGLGLQIGWAQPVVRINSPSNPSTAKDSLSTHLHLNGLKVGLVYDASYIAGFGSSMGINYTFGISKGKWQAVNPGYNQFPQSRTIVSYHQVEVFVDWQYKFEIAKETYLMLYTGPTIQCGLELHMRQDTRTENYTTGEITTTYGDWFSAYTTDKENEHMRRMNVTWGVGAGFQYKRYFLRGGYDFGLINPYASRQFVDATGQVKDQYTRGRMDQWSIKLGIYFWYQE